MSTPVYDQMTSEPIRRGMSSREGRAMEKLKAVAMERERVSVNGYGEEAPEMGMTISDALEGLSAALATLVDTQCFLADKLLPILIDSPQPAIGGTERAYAPNTSRVVGTIQDLTNLVNDSRHYIDVLQNRVSI